MPNKITLHDLNCQGKRVFCRVDFNVPLDAQRQITDDTRIRAALPTIRKILAQGGRLILGSHLGRPKGCFKSEYSLAPIAPRLSELLGQPVIMAPDVIGPEVEQLVGNLRDGEVVLLENLRFYPGEEQNDPHFSRQLADLAEVYVNDAFGTAHRAHASTVGVARLLQPAAAGYLMEKELKYLGTSLANPDRPFVAILGGAKVSDKIMVIQALLEKVDTLIIGGGMAYTFLKAQNYPIGKSLIEEDKLDLALDLIRRANECGTHLMLPVDHLVAREFSADAAPQVCDRESIPEDCMALDIGPETLANFTRAIQDARTVVWNGPMGVFEFPAFSRGTFGVAQALADSSALTIIGGGDSVAAVNQSGLQDRMTHISTGGGASLEFLEGRTLPGVATLSDRQQP